VITRKGLSGITIQIDTAHCDAGHQATVASDGDLTGETVTILGSVQHTTALAIKLFDGKVTTKQPEQVETTAVSVADWLRFKRNEES